jgi:hypothetical protein
MSFSLEDVLSHFSPDAINQIGGPLGLSADQVQQATHALLTHAATGDPAAAVQNAAEQTGLDPSTLANLLPQVMSHLSQSSAGPLTDVVQSLQSNGFAAQLEQGAGSLLGNLFRSS